MKCQSEVEQTEYSISFIANYTYMKILISKFLVYNIIFSLKIPFFFPLMVNAH